VKRAISFSRRVFAPELCHGTARKLCLQIKEGEAERR
jgi:hypothetical protein